jgi:Ca2+-binding EF-hand superfamily protein
MEMKTQTRDEVVAHVRDMFARIDANKDGFITRAEADAAHGKMAGDMREGFARRLAERGVQMPDRNAMFDRLDTNKDGQISRQEYVAAQPQVTQRQVIVMREGKNGAMGGPGMMRMHRKGMGMGGRMFERADANRDGKVSLQEMTTAALQHFDSADANHDGKLTPDERMQMRSRVKVQRIQRPA